MKLPNTQLEYGIHFSNALSNTGHDVATGACESTRGPLVPCRDLESGDLPA